MIRIVCDRCGKEIPASGRACFLAWNFRNGYGCGPAQGNIPESMDYCETCMETIFDFINRGYAGTDVGEGSGGAEGTEPAGTAIPWEKTGDGGKPVGSSLPAKETDVCREKARRPRRNSIDMGKVMALRDAGWSYGKIADEMGMSKQSVCNAISRWKKAHGTGGDVDTGTEERMKG
ncbi:MAG TPA: hypothetical protein DCZ91_13425 [Lachnospiraceae bacterium]|nr:hypothetical protein [Lachnospiraceae bacterium]